MIILIANVFVAHSVVCMFDLATATAAAAAAVVCHSDCDVLVEFVLFRLIVVACCDCA